MSLEKTTHWLLSNSAYQAGIVAVCLILQIVGVPAGILVSVLLALVTLQSGFLRALPLLALVWLVFVVTYWHGLGMAMFILAVDCTVVTLLASLLGRHGSWRLLLEAMVLLGIVIVLAIHAYNPAMNQWWAAKLMGLIQTKITDAAELANFKLALSYFVPYLTGLIVTYLLLSMILELIIARAWQAAVYNAGAFKREFLQLRMSRWLAVLLLLICVGALFKLSWCSDVVAVVTLPFMLVGLSLMHSFASVNKRGIILLLLVYVGLFFFGFVFLIILSFLGYIDSWWDIRQRFPIKN